MILQYSINSIYILNPQLSAVVLRPPDPALPQASPSCLALLPHPRGLAAIVVKSSHSCCKLQLLLPVYLLSIKQVFQYVNLCNYIHVIIISEKSYFFQGVTFELKAVPNTAFSDQVVYGLRVFKQQIRLKYGCFLVEPKQYCNINL
ncbi:Hypothetical_protein [Hexamita inflata]|uniref:Hypothetical_protein n=1 Tax=Hexamita inflata TaxID=28002 RepID=A0AA86Q530_9EUKA|nr:Hypothetical protein HINF_LOCUS33925 [Hexamita inflata]